MEQFAILGEKVNKMNDIKTALNFMDPPPSDAQLFQIDFMINFLLDYCKKVNLTAIRERGAVIEKHIVDSLLPLTLYEFPRGAACIDIGTGAGFPAIPIMIMRPDLKFTLLDARQKRTIYLTELCERISLKPKIVHGRAEELNRKENFRGKYDVAIARAVGSLELLTGYGAPFLKKDGVLLAMKGRGEENFAEFEKSLKKNKAELAFNKSYSLPSGDHRCLLGIKRVN